MSFFLFLISIHTFTLIFSAAVTEMIVFIFIFSIKKRKLKSIQKKYILITLSTLSHELREPLNSIMAYTTLTKFNKKLDQITKLNLEKIIHTSDYLINITNNFLTTSKILNKTISLKEEIVNLNELLEEVLVITYNTTVSKDIKLGLNKDEYNLFFKLDKTCLKQILINLITNAYKYTPNGNKVFITLKTYSKEKDNVEIIIEDTGEGMSDEYLKSVYTPYSRQNELNPEVKGTGLGMYIVKDLVKVLNGKIDIVSKREIGTRIELLFSFKQVEENECTMTKLITNNQRILFVDDIKVNQDLNVAIAKDLGLYIDVASNGQEAIDLLNRHEATYYSLILLDMRMPILDGYETTKIIRNTKIYNNIPIIAMTGDSFQDDIDKAFKLGVSDYLIKPINIKAIKDCYLKWL